MENNYNNKCGLDNFSIRGHSYALLKTIGNSMAIRMWNRHLFWNGIVNPRFEN